MKFKDKLNEVLLEVFGEETPEAMPTPMESPRSELELPEPQSLEPPESLESPESPEPSPEPAVEGIIFQLKNQLQGYTDKSGQLMKELGPVIGKDDANEFIEALTDFSDLINDYTQRIMTGIGPKSPSEVLAGPELPTEPGLPTAEAKPVAEMPELSRV